MIKYRFWIYLTLLLPISAFGSVILITDGAGELAGADGVDVNGTFYDVRFFGGTCADLFDGCDDASDFTFGADSAAVDAASNALLDQVLIDSGLGQFDTDPELTFLCENQFQCSIFTPWNVASFLPVIETNRAINQYSLGTDSTQFLDSFVGGDFGPQDAAVWAVWSPSVSAVPAPAAIWLFGTGILGLVGFSKRRKAA